MVESPNTRPSLLVRIRDPQDERAWAEFLDIYTPLIYQVARRKGLQEADAADLVQEVFRAVAGAIDRWDPDPRRGAFRASPSPIAPHPLANFLIPRGPLPPGSGAPDTSSLPTPPSPPPPPPHTPAH